MESLHRVWGYTFFILGRKLLGYEFNVKDQWTDMYIFVGGGVLFIGFFFCFVWLINSLNMYIAGEGKKE